jgi:hypothetical protein
MPTAERIARWSTIDELALIDRLASKSNARAALEGYLRGMRRRTEFGLIDAPRCIARAEAELALLGDTTWRLR